MTEIRIEDILDYFMEKLEDEKEHNLHLARRLTQTRHFIRDKDLAQEFLNFEKGYN